MCAVEGDGAGQGSDSNAGIYIYTRQVLQGGAGLRVLEATWTTGGGGLVVFLGSTWSGG